MKIAIIHSGLAEEIIILGSVLIGLKKKFPSSQIIWIGPPECFSLMKFNKRIHKCIDIHSDLSFKVLSSVYSADLCINYSDSKEAKQMVSLIGAKNILGYSKNGPENGSANFFDKIIHGDICTRKHILDIYYSVADLKWNGEGYGLSYYPKQKKENIVGVCTTQTIIENATQFTLKPNLMKSLDKINQFNHIHTDNLFVAHAAIALRKETYLYASLPYEIEFFGKGRQIRPESKDFEHNLSN